MNKKSFIHGVADNNFNLLRLLAAFFVLVSHSFGILDKGLQQPGLFYANNHIILSDVGLATFFTISGFLVTQSLLNSDSYTHYLWKRFLRIVPALAVVSFVCVVVGSMITSLTLKDYFWNANTWSYFFVNISLLANAYTLPGVFLQLHNHSVNASIWTILVEVRCYVGLLAVSFFKILQYKWLLLCGFVALQLLRVYIDELHKLQVPSINLHVYFLYGTYFYLGVLFYRFKDAIPFKWFYANILMAIAFLTANTVVESITLSVFFAYCILIIGTAKAVVNLRGYDVSYGLYLYAFPVQQLVLLYLGYLINVWFHIVISTFIASILAFLSWTFVEKPFLKKKNLFALG